VTSSGILIINVRTEGVHKGFKIRK